MLELYELAGADTDIRFSPYCWRIRMAMAHKGLHPRLIPWHFGEKRLPGGASRVPVLVDDGEVIADSTDIAFHLEDKYDHGPSLFGGETGEAHARFIIAWTDTVLQPALFPLIGADIFSQVKPEARAYFRETREKRLGTTLEDAAAGRAQALAGLRALMQPLRLAVEAQTFLGGDEPSYADYTVFGAFQWVRSVSRFDPLDEEDPIHAWRERVLDLFDGAAAMAKTIADSRAAKPRPRPGRGVARRGSACFRPPQFGSRWQTLSSPLSQHRSGPCGSAGELTMMPGGCG